MKNVNVGKLKSVIMDNGINVETLAEKLGIDRSTLYRKLSKVWE